LGDTKVIVSLTGAVVLLATVWGYSALETGIVYLPMVGAIMVMAGVSAQLVPRPKTVGASRRPSHRTAVTVAPVRR